MKKILLAMLLSLLATTTYANRHGHGHWQRGHNGSWTWVVPAVIGGVIVYEATRPPLVVQQPPIILQPQPNCSPWTETQNSDGTITRTRTCTQ